MTDTQITAESFRGRGSLEAVVNELQRQIETRVDVVCDTRDLRVITGEDGDLRLAAANRNLADFLPPDGVSVLDQALSQFGAKAPVTNGIPTRFLRHAAKEHPLRTADFLTGIMHDSPDRRLVRLLDGSCRAFLSDSYKVVDSLDVAKVVLEQAQKVGAKVIEASVTDASMRLKLFSPDVWDTLDRGDYHAHEGTVGTRASRSYMDQGVRHNIRGGFQMHGGPSTVWPVFTVGNSETGHGKFYGRAGFLVPECTNGISVEETFAHIHHGSKMDIGVYSQSTRVKEADLLFCQFRDAISASFTLESFKALCARVRGSISKEVRSPTTAVELIIKSSEVLGDDDFATLLDHFVAEPGTSSLYNLGQAVARLSQDASADKAGDLESLAGEIVTGKHTGKLKEALVA